MAPQMTPDKSIYDLARVVFAGNSVMLKEHFRCVPAIIEYSNREFYRATSSRCACQRPTSAWTRRWSTCSSRAATARAM